VDWKELQDLCWDGLTWIRGKNVYDRLRNLISTSLPIRQQDHVEEKVFDVFGQFHFFLKEEVRLLQCLCGNIGMS
jgi:ribosomal protein L5